MCPQLMQNVNISFEICANVSGSPMDLYKDDAWILWRDIWILYRSLYESCDCFPWIPIMIYMDPYMGPIWIPIWIHVSENH